jgi:hypothetical protein
MLHFPPYRITQAETLSLLGRPNCFQRAGSMVTPPTIVIPDIPRNAIAWP